MGEWKGEKTKKYIDRSALLEYDKADMEVVKRIPGCDVTGNELLQGADCLIAE